jgi:hypothetical protein
VRTLVLVLSIGTCLAFAGAAQADIGVTITTLDVRAGGVLRGFGNASGMPVYLVPESQAPHPIRCHDGRAYCAPTLMAPTRSVERDEVSLAQSRDTRADRGDPP